MSRSADMRRIEALVRGRVRRAGSAGTAMALRRRGGAGAGRGRRSGAARGGLRWPPRGQRHRQRRRRLRGGRRRPAGARRSGRGRTAALGVGRLGRCEAAAAGARLGEGPLVGAWGRPVCSNCRLVHCTYPPLSGTRQGREQPVACGRCGETQGTFVAVAALLVTTRAKCPPLQVPVPIGSGSEQRAATRAGGGQLPRGAGAGARAGPPARLAARRAGSAGRARWFRARQSREQRARCPHVPHALPLPSRCRGRCGRL